MSSSAEATAPEHAPGEASLHRALGLTDDEFEAVGKILGRPPNHLELALYAVMWSEHCSYKSSRLHLRRLPTEGPRVLVGPGENAGVIDAGDGIAVAIRIESHNHPSAIEPYQGAATGVGGILRDIFTMGARPLAVMDPLFFGPPDDARQRWLVEGVVAGISGYGNSVGVPTVGGELTFDPCYAQNPLVNVLCLGALPNDRLVLGIASGPGNLAVLLGSSTGRDGIGGVSVLASAGFSGDEAGAADDTKRPSVQVGDPFEEKRLIEACLELLDTKLVVGIQDLGGAGLACATSETAGRGGVGMDVDVTAVPRREDGMEPWEVMTSESQERMLAIVTPEAWPAVSAICAKWEVRATVIGTVMEPDPAGGGRLRIRDGLDGPILADVPAASLSDDAPLYDRPRRAPSAPTAAPPAPPPTDGAADLLTLLRSARWVYRQYDHQLFLNTVAGPGADAALLRLAGPGLPPSVRGVAVTTDSNPRACALDPRHGTALVLAEAVANLACVGATPAAVVNCLNFGNPEHPEVMWQLSECIDGMADACRALSLPVIGGNVSLYNESGGADIDPTPVLGVLGLVDELRASPPGAAWRDGDAVVVLGARSAPDGSFPLEGTRWATECRDHRAGSLPPVDFAAHRAICAFVTTLVAAQVAGAGADLVHAVHDVSGGGLAVAAAEMAAQSSVGCALEVAGGPAELFTELPSRFLVATSRPAELTALAASAGVAASVLGRAQGDRVALGDQVDLPLAAVRTAFEGNLTRALGES
ncbi:MAG TPA: phosphoribosylformylglycinamidine synthase subunit PurL [Acidimicrobiales bacterium]|nr:phosphoribosylformylglycinamidine synthase subunit PurL [Acidimicrobiales bacterium]